MSGLLLSLEFVSFTDSSLLSLYLEETALFEKPGNKCKK
jgi:hypothetical protein